MLSFEMGEKGNFLTVKKLICGEDTKYIGSFIPVFLNFFCLSNKIFQNKQMLKPHHFDLTYGQYLAYF